MNTRLLNRYDAGYQLAEKLLEYKECPNGIVLGLPRGGIAIASVIAQKLQLPLDICLAKKLGSPQNPEVAIGAIAKGVASVESASLSMRKSNSNTNDIVLVEQYFLDQPISDSFLSVAIAHQKEKLAKYQAISQQINKLTQNPQYELKNCTVILVDDGVATGLTLQAGIATLKQHQVKDIIVAVPVIAQDLIETIANKVTQLVYLIAPKNLNAVSFWYQEFSQVSDQEMVTLLLNRIDRN